MTITCGSCGFCGDFETFINTPIGGALPRGQFQCPTCNHAWRLQGKGNGTQHRSGLYIPPTIELVTVPTQL